MPALLFPLGLLALAGLMVPLLVHLARREAGKRISFAALRYLAPRPRPQARRRFEEWPLLLVRMLLLAVLALWLAAPVWRGWLDRRPVVALAPGVDMVEARALLAGARGARALWLAPGFPAFGASAPPPGPTASLIRELDAGLAPGVALRLVVPPQLAGLDGGTIKLSRPVDWVVVAGAATLPEPAVLPGWTVRHAPDRRADARWFARAAAALERRLDLAPLGAPLPDVPGPLIWLAEGAPPAPVLDWVRRGGVVLVRGEAGAGVPLWRNAAGVPIVEGRTLGRGRVLTLLPALVPQRFPELVEPEFPARLAALLEPAPPPDRGAASLLAPAAGGPPPVLPALDLRPWLALLLAVVLLVERWLATSPRRGARP